MGKVDELIAALNKEEKKKSNILVWVLAIVGAVAAIAGIAYAVYRFLTPDYLEDFEEDFEDDFDDCFEDEDKAEKHEEKKADEEAKEAEAPVNEAAEAIKANVAEGAAQAAKTVEAKAAEE